MASVHYQRYYWSYCCISLHSVRNAGHTFTYVPTSKGDSAIWEANIVTAGQDISNLLWNLRFCYCVLEFLLCTANEWMMPNEYSPHSHILFKYHFNNIMPSVFMSCKWCLSSLRVFWLKILFTVSIFPVSGTCLVSLIFLHVITANSKIILH